MASACSSSSVSFNTPDNKDITGSSKENKHSFVFTWDIKTKQIKPANLHLETLFNKQNINWLSEPFFLKQMSGSSKASEKERYKLVFNRWNTEVESEPSRKLERFHEGQDCRGYLNDLISAGVYLTEKSNTSRITPTLTQYQYEIIEVLTFTEIWQIIDKNVSLTVMDLDDTLVQNYFLQDASLKISGHCAPAELSLEDDFQKFRKSHPDHDFILITNSIDKLMYDKLSATSISTDNFITLLPRIGKGYKKAPRLQNFLSTCIKKYHHIFIVDDDIDNIQTLVGFCKKEGINATGIHYLGLILQKHSFFRARSILKRKINENYSMEMIYGHFTCLRYEYDRYVAKRNERECNSTQEQK